jgi:hypothetical protein
MTVSIKLPDDHVKYLQKMSHYVSIERDQNLTLSDLIREAIQANYPMPLENQSDNQKQDDGSQRL